MKKLLITIFIFLLTVIVPSNAQIFNNNETGTGTDTEIQSSVNKNSDEVDPGGGFFRAGSDDYERPGIGEGIGETPIADGLSILMLCCMFFGSIKFFRKEKKPV